MKVSYVYKNYEDCLKIILILSKDFSYPNLLKIKHAINVCDSLYDEKEKIWRLTQTVVRLLWDNNRAVETGFTKYLKEESKEIRNMLGYHDANCEDTNTCPVCKTMKTQVELLCGEY